MPTQIIIDAAHFEDDVYDDSGNMLQHMDFNRADIWLLNKIARIAISECNKVNVCFKDIQCYHSQEHWRGCIHITLIRDYDATKLNSIMESVKSQMKEPLHISEFSLA